MTDSTRFEPYTHSAGGWGSLKAVSTYLLRERKLEPRTVKLHVSALRFFFVKTLKRPYLLDDIPYA